MKHVTAILDNGDDPQVIAAGRVLARILGVDLVRFPVPLDDASERAGTVIDALQRDHVAAAVLSARGPAPVCWNVITRVDVPVLVLPAQSQRALTEIATVLLPLDGSPQTASAVADMARRTLGFGAHVVAVHVFDTDTVPAFWDQAAHAHDTWTLEFLRRNLPEAVELDLRRGRPAEQVLAEADRAGVDLMVIAWGRDLSSGRAATVRLALTEGSVPVLLVATDPGG